MTSADTATTPAEGELSFPREKARTLNHSLGRPRTFSAHADSGRVLFLRSSSGTDRVTDLWCLDAATGEERLLVAARDLASGGDGEELSALERARRERMRENAAGIVAYSHDDALEHVAFTWSGRLFVADVETGTSRELAAQDPVIDPRIDPTGRRIAYASRGQLRVVDVADGRDVALLEPAHDLEVWGVADFAAAEELERSRGFWWSPDGSRLLVERYDETPVEVRWVSEPSAPERAPVPHRYPAAGTPNAEVTVWLVDALGAAEAVPVEWDRTAFEYLVTAHWSSRGEPLLQVLNRRQDRAQVLAVSDDGTTSLVREQQDPCWVDVVPGTPAWTTDGRLVTVEVAGPQYALCLDGEPVTPSGVQVRSVLDVGDHGVVVAGYTEPSEHHLYRWDGEQTVALTEEPGVHGGVVDGPLVVVSSATLDDATVRTRVQHLDGGSTVEIRSLALVPRLTPTVQLVRSGDLEVAVLLPRDHVPGTALPVLMDPYGGPHFGQVLKAQGAFRESQWFADQGFAVVVCDGRGTPRDPQWERAVRFDLADCVLEDQVRALRIAAEHVPDLDTSRVGIRGWSFGGYLSAMAVLRRPDVFHAAVAGAPVTDYRLYDTAYTERYLGLPQEQPEAYARASLLADAPGLQRPLMLIHGFADDNVLVANTLQLSGELMAAGRAHTVLPLAGVTHMTPQEDVAENLLLLQVDFLHEALRGPTA